jgi:phage tail-like protein
MAEAKTTPCKIGRNPYLSVRFRVEIEGLQVCSFNEVTGLTAETEVESFREGGLNSHERQLAGPTKYPSKLVLKRGMADTEELWKWYKDVRAGRIERKAVSIVLQDSAGDEKRRWVFQKSCPVKWAGPTFKADSAEIAFETIEMIHEGLASVTQKGSSQK